MPLAAVSLNFNFTCTKKGPNYGSYLGVLKSHSKLDRRVNAEKYLAVFGTFITLQQP